MGTKNQMKGKGMANLFTILIAFILVLPLSMAAVGDMDGDMAGIGNLSVEGRIGIGTTDPSSVLQIEVPTLSNQMTLGSWTGVTFSMVNNGAYGLFGGVAGNGNPWLQAGRTDTATSYDLVLQASGGKLGVGTRSPDSNLHIGGSDATIQARIGRGGFVEYGELESKNTGVITLRAGHGNSGDTVLAFETASSGIEAERMRLDSAGNVGIGTSNPNATLHVIGNESALNIGQGDLFVNTSSGNVGIGTTSPSVKLDVVGNITSNETIIASFFIGDGSGLTGLSSSSDELLDSDSDTKIQVEESADEDKIRFDTAGTERVVIDDTGKVGIGTANPTEKLDVTGNISLGVDTDYVIRKKLNSEGDIMHFTRSDDSQGGYLKYDGWSALEWTKRFIAGGISIGTTDTDAAFQVYSAGIPARFGNSNAVSSLSRTIPGVELITGGVGGVDYYGTGIKFMSQDPELTTENPKLLAAIIPRSTEEYSGDADGGMTLDFATTPNNPGTTNVPLVRMTISNDGNVGIGTTSPLGRVDVQASTNDGSTDALVIRDNDSVELQSIDSDGRFSTVNPQSGADLGTSSYRWSDLHMSGTVGFYGSPATYSLSPVEIQSRTGTNFIQTLDMDSGNAWEFTSDPNMEFTDTDGEQSFVYAEPKINQSGTAAYNGLKINVLETTIGDGSTGDGNNLFNTAIEGVSKFVIDRTGKVGIGTTSPSQKLEVNGNVIANRAHFRSSTNVGETALTAVQSGASSIAQFKGHSVISGGIIIDSNPTDSTTSLKSKGALSIKQTADVLWAAKSAWNIGDLGDDAAPALADLDNDGDYDIMMGLDNGTTLGYENTGTVSSPTWTAKSDWNLPDIGTESAPILGDLDGDGDYDLLVGTDDGVCYAYENTGSATSPTWTNKDTWDTSDVGDDAIPALADIDNDGDLDLLIGEGSTTSKGYENTGSSSSPTWTAKTDWDTSGGGYPAFIDYDSDGDYDLLLAQATNSRTYVYENVGSLASPAWLNYAPGYIWYISGGRGRPAAADLDNDGDYDFITGVSDGSTKGYENTAVQGTALFVGRGNVGIGTTSPTVKLGVNGSLFANRGQFRSNETISLNVVQTQNNSIAQFRSHHPTGASLTFGASPNKATTTLTSSGSLEIKSTSVAWRNRSEWNGPTDTHEQVRLADLDGDGDLDMMVGGYSGNPDGYENTGSISSPIWTENPYWHVKDDLGGGQKYPALADLDNDGDYDMLLGIGSNLLGYENTGSASYPIWTYKEEWNVSGRATVVIADLDNDGDYDLITGYGGHGYGYENTGNLTNLTWTYKADWNPPDVNNFYPAIADLDNDGDFDLMIGDGMGNNNGYENTGSVSSPIWTNKDAWDGPKLDAHSRPAFGDIDGDGDQDMIISLHGSFGVENIGSHSTALSVTSGNVGIGTSNPNATLHVAGDINVTTGNDICIDGGSCLSSVSGGGSTNWTDGDSVLYYDTGADVGIGTASPTETLHVYDSSGTTLKIHETLGYSTLDYNTLSLYSGNLLIDTAGTGKTTFTSGNAQPIDFSARGYNFLDDYTGTAGTFYVQGDVGIGTANPNATLHIVGNESALNINQGDLFVNASSGDVGIGTTSPSTKLHVVGNITSNETITAVTFIGDGSQLSGISIPTDIVFDADNDTKIQVEKSADEDKIRFDTAGSERMIIDNDGNVGIGTMTPTATLGVTGTFEATQGGITWSAKSDWDTGNLGYSTKPVFIDLDNDGDLDMMVGTSSLTVMAYENTGSASSPTWTDKNDWDAPTGGSGYTRPSFADIDNDGDYDMMVGESQGTVIGFENTGNSTSPTWAKKESWNTTDLGLYSDPTLADLDGDNDYDMLIGTYQQGTLAYENTGSVSSPNWTAKTDWKLPRLLRTDINDHPALADLDADGDYDVLIGSNSGINIAYENIGNATNLRWAGKSDWAFPDLGGNTIPGIADLDNDGDMDLLIGELQGSVYGYENTDSDISSFYVGEYGNLGINNTNPGQNLDVDGNVFVEGHGQFLGSSTTAFTAVQSGNSSIAQFKSHHPSGGGLIIDASPNEASTYLRPSGSLEIKHGSSIEWTENSAWSLPDIGGYAAPALADLDNDGDYDILVGELYSSSALGVENTGSAKKPIWSANNDFDSPIFDTAYPKATLVDIDNDGDYDLFIGGSEGIGYGYENTGTPTKPIWADKDEWDTPGVGAHTNTAFADLDNDGDYDLLIGDYWNQAIFAYENTGNTSSPTWTDKNDWDAVTEIGYNKYLYPVTADFDNDGDFDLLVGINNGSIYGYENTGSASSPAWTANSNWDLPNAVPGNARLSTADLDNDGDYDILVGTNDGTATAYENTGTRLTALSVTSGNVGIGTSNPNATLHVAGDINVTTGNDICIDGGNCLSSAGGSSNWTDGDSVLYYNTGGNVGIGTTAPNVKLEIAGSPANISAGTENELILTRAFNPGVSYPQVVAFGLGSYGGGQFNTRLDISLKHSGSNDFVAETTVMTLLGNGNVGIGKTAPVSTLDVDGMVNSTGLCINGDCKTSWDSDRVFTINGNQAPLEVGTEEEFTIVRPLNPGNVYPEAVSFFVGRHNDQGQAPFTRLDIKLKKNSDSSTVGDTTIMTLLDNGNVGIGTETPTQKIEVDGGLRLDTTTSKPTCDSTTRGTFWFEQSGSGVDDFIYACMKNDDETLSWIMVARG